MLHRILFLCFFVLSISTSAQQKTNDIALISATIQNYFDGYIQRDINQLNAAFDTVNGTMKVPSKAKDGSVQYENHYFKEIVKKWAARKKLSTAELQNCALEILNIDVVDGKIGSAKISMKVGAVTYIDILSLQKINENWKITNKIYLVLEK